MLALAVRKQRVGATWRSAAAPGCAGGIRGDRSTGHPMIGADPKATGAQRDAMREPGEIDKPAEPKAYSTLAGIFATDIKGCATWSSSSPAFCSSPSDIVSN